MNVKKRNGSIYAKWVRRREINWNLGLGQRSEHVEIRLSIMKVMLVG